jgi:hypothetical protein
MMQYVHNSCQMGATFIIDGRLVDIIGYIGGNMVMEIHSSVFKYSLFVCLFVCLFRTKYILFTTQLRVALFTSSLQAKAVLFTSSLQAESIICLQAVYNLFTC